MEPFIPEPVTEDPTWGRRGEQPMAWLHRSTNERSQRIRAFLNDGLARLPPEAQTSIGSRLDHQWQAALFELIVGRVLQVMGAALEYEVDTGTGRRLDWLATFPDGPIGVEATVPLINASVDQIEREHEPTLDLIERLIPPGWTVLAVSVPATPGNASRRPIRAVLQRWVDELAGVNPQREVEYVEDGLPGGELHLIFRPILGDQVIQMHPGGVFWDDSKERIRSAVERKKAQASGAPWPVLLAVRGSGLGTDIGDYDQALLGNTVDVLDQDRVLAEVRFDAVGVFGEERQEPPTFAGVLAFVEVGPLSGSEPILYPHPRFPARLPRALLALGKRRYGGEGIEGVPRTGAPVMEQIGLAQPEQVLGTTGVIESD